MLEDERGLWDTAIIRVIAAVYIVRKPGLRISEDDVTNPSLKQKYTTNQSTSRALFGSPG